MATPDGTDWLATAWEILKWMLGISGTAASTVAIWFLRRYHERVAMLLRHEERLNQNDTDLGEQKQYRGATAEMLAQKFKQNDREHRKLHKRINTRRAEQVETDKAIAEMKTDIRWIREYLAKNGHEE